MKKKVNQILKAKMKLMMNKQLNNIFLIYYIYIIQTI